MKIGFFDSGVGGLVVAHAVTEQLHNYDVLYLGDTIHAPYGEKPPEQIYEFTIQGVKFLFDQDCALVIVACNSAVAAALAKIQTEWLPTHYPDRRVLGVLIPAAEAAIRQSPTQRFGVLATMATVLSEAYELELKKLSSQALVYQVAAPELVPLIEADDIPATDQWLDHYLAQLTDKHIDTLILGCTHYPLLKDQVRQKLGSDVRVISQDEVVPESLKLYLSRHPELETKLTKTGDRQFYVTNLTPGVKSFAERSFGESVNLQTINLG